MILDNNSSNESNESNNRSDKYRDDESNGIRIDTTKETGSDIVNIMDDEY